MTNDKTKESEKNHNQHHGDHNQGKAPAKEEPARHPPHAKHDEKGAGHEKGHPAPPPEKAAQKDAAEPARAKAPTVEEHAALNDKFLRLMADFDNFRKRVVRDRVDFSQRANEDIMRELLPVLDHLELALEAAKAANEQGPVADGFKMVAEQLVETLGKFGLASFESTGKPFDPALHEGVSTLSSETAPENTVVVEIRKGYMLGGRLLRPARVVISSGKQAQPAPAASAGAGKQNEEKKG